MPDDYVFCISALYSIKRYTSMSESPDQLHMRSPAYPAGKTKDLITLLPSADTLPQFSDEAGVFHSEDRGCTRWYRVPTVPLKDVGAIEPKCLDLVWSMYMNSHMLSNCTSTLPLRGLPPAPAMASSSRPHTDSQRARLHL